MKLVRHIIKILVKIFTLSCVFFLFQLNAIGERTHSQDLIFHLSSSPNTNSVKAVLNAIGTINSTNEYDQLKATFEAALSNTNREVQETAWNALAAHPTADFNSMLSEQIEEPTNLTNQSFVKAIMSADAPSIEIQLLELALAKESPLTHNFDIKQVWHLAYKIDPVLATSVFLESYTPSNLHQNEIDEVSADILVELLQDISSNRDAVSSTVSHMMDFVIGNATSVPLHLGTPKTARYRVNKAIETLLQTQRTPIAEAALLVFADADSSDFSDLARSNDYLELKKAPWLIPDSSWGQYLMPRNKWELDQLEWDLKNHFEPSRVESLRFTNAIAILHGWGVSLPEDQYFCFNVTRHYYETSKNWSTHGDGASSPRALESIVAEQKALVQSLINSFENVLSCSETNATLASQIENIGHTFGPDLDKPQLVGAAATPFYYALPSVLKNLYTNIEAFDSGPTVSFLIDSEMTRRALLMYAAAQYYRKAGVQLNSVPTLSDLDNTIEQLIKTGRPALRTTVTTGEGWSNTVWQFARQPLKLTDDRVFGVIVKEREISFLTSTYHERLEVEGESGNKFNVDWIGELPLPFIPLLEQHPRFLDLTDFSFTIHELSSRGESGRRNWDDLDLVLAKGGASIPLLQMAAMHQEVDWRDIKEALAVSTPFDGYAWTKFAFYGDIFHWKDNTLPDVLSTNEKFKACVDQLMLSYNKALQFRELGRMIAQLKDCANGITTDKNFGDFLSDVGTVLGSGFTKGPKTPRLDYKNSVIGAINNLIDAHNEMGQDWIPLLCALPPEDNGNIYVSSAQVLFDPDLTQFIEHVDLQSKSFTDWYAPSFSQPLEVPPLIKYWLKRALLIDPYFMSRNYLDLFVTEDGMQRLSSTLYEVPMANDRAAIIQRDLEKVGLLPFAYKYSQSDIAKIRVRPFENSIEGIAYKAEIKALLTAREYLQPGKNSQFNFLVNKPPPNYPGLPTFLSPPATNFLKQAISSYGKTVHDADSHAQIEIDKIKGQIRANANPDHNWFAGLSWVSGGGQSGRFGIDFNYDDFGINTSWHPDNGIQFGASVKGIPLPGTIAIPFNTNAYAGNQIDKQHELALIPNKDSFSINHPMWTTFAAEGSLGSTSDRSGGGGVLVSMNYSPTGIAWWQMPILKDGSRLPHEHVLERIVFKGAAYQSLPKLNVLADNQVNNFLTQPIVDVADYNRFVKAARSGTSTADYLDSDYVQTEFVSSGLFSDEQDNGSGNRRPAAASISNYNERALREFNGHVEAMDKKESDGIVFANDGLPDQTITLCGNCRLMMFTYTYPLTSGGSLALQLMQETPPALIAAIAENPSGHVFEKSYYGAAPEAVKTSLSRLGLPPLRSSTIAASRSEFEKVSLGRDRQFGNAFADDVNQSVKEYTEALEKWSAQQKRGKVRPFIPPPHGSPILSHIGTVYDIYKRLTRAVSNLEASLLKSSFGKLLQDHSITFSRPKLQQALAIRYINSHAANRSSGMCATFVSEAIRAAGIPLSHIGGSGNAADMGPVLLRAGFHAMPEGIALEPGDVAVIAPYPGQTPATGHAAMWDGARWVSDYKQGGPTPLSPYPNDSYRSSHPRYTVYRWPTGR